MFLKGNQTKFFNCIRSKVDKIWIIFYYFKDRYNIRHKILVQKWLEILSQGIMINLFNYGEIILNSIHNQLNIKSKLLIFSCKNLFISKTKFVK